MDFQRFQLTGDLQAALQRARREAERRHNIYLDVEHEMLGLLRHTSGTAHALFTQHGVDLDKLYTQVADAVGMERSSPIDLKAYSAAAQQALGRAKQEADALGHGAVDTGHLLLSLMHEDNGAVSDAVRELPFSADDLRAYLREHPPAAPSKAVSATARSVTQRRTASRSDPNAREEYVLIPTRTASKPKTTGNKFALPNRALLVGGLIALLVYMWFVLPQSSIFVFVFVLIGWVFSVTLHEFAHALVAYIGGDHTVRHKGYLTFNPLKYTHPLLSIVLPLVFLALGGIGLPGGAVYIERHRLKNKWWGAAVSAAGPLANLLLAVLLAIPFMTGIVDIHAVGANIWFDENKDTLLRRNPGLDESALRDMVGIEKETIWNNPTLWSAIAFLAMLQFTAVFFNLIPIPPLDGYGIIEPYLDERTRMQLRQLSMMGIFLIFFLFMYITPVRQAFWNGVYDTTNSLDIPGWMIDEGYNEFMFWRTER